MLSTLKRLALGLGLIVAASAVLLVADWNRRTGTATTRRTPSIAILQHASTQLLDDCVRGMREGLADRGLRDGATVMIRAFNAEGDVATSNTVAKAITTGEYDLVLTASTPSMQAVASANKAGLVPHVFGAVADPFGAGIGLDRNYPLNHPAHLVGLGTLLPVDDSFEFARTLFPALRTIGVAWNPSESNSQTFTRMARVAATRMGLTLLEANVDNSSAVGEAVSSLAGRGAEAIWVGGDNTMLLAIGTVIATAQREGIPVFTITPAKPDRGTLFDIGIDFYEIGRMTGRLAGDVLHGTNPATLPIRDVLNDVPRRVVLNTLALKGLKGAWRAPPEIASRADIVVDESGIHTKAAPSADFRLKPEATSEGTPPEATSRAPLNKQWRIGLVQYVDAPTTEEMTTGVFEGLRDAGLVRDRDFVVKIRNAQGDMATLNSLIDASMGDGADALLTLSTPTLQAALPKASNVPVVFSLVASAVLAGAGRSAQDHLPNVTGIETTSDYEGLARAVREIMPKARRVGTLFTPAEVNSVFNKDRWTEAARAVGLEVIAVPATTSAEVSDAALAMVSRQLDAVCQISDNLSMVSFASILNAARRSRLPVFGFQSVQVRDGAVAAVARDYTDAGRDTAALMARIMRGESPSRIPFSPPKNSRLVS